MKPSTRVKRHMLKLRRAGLPTCAFLPLLPGYVKPSLPRITAEGYLIWIDEVFTKAASEFSKLLPEGFRLEIERGDS